MNGYLLFIKRVMRKMTIRGRHPYLKHRSRPRKKKFPVEIRSALLMGICTLLAAAISVTAVYQSHKAKELREILNDLGEMNSLLAEEYQAYLSVTKTLAGKPVYGPEHIEEFRRLNKYPDRFIEDLRVREIVSVLETAYDAGHYKDLDFSIFSFVEQDYKDQEQQKGEPA
jgi:hypothetical protein